MTNIADRLRDWQDYEPMKQFCAEAIPDLLEAADVIKRLRAARLADAARMVKMSDEYETAQDEIERLRQDNDLLRHLVRHALNEEASHGR